ncbi:MAG TPA: histidine kinase [Dehalococcoidia bacterium]|nr:histidine kinase [Dehalococcoidia bacterium]
MAEEKVNKLEEEIADLKARWPAHSVKPSMLQKLEELEEKLEQARRKEAESA